jgi:hypothetical protein
MASEPAPRQDELDREWLAGMVAAFLSGARGVTALKPWPEVAERLVAWLDERRLLADPAQTAELAEAQRSARFWQGLAEYWEREHQNTVLPYTNKLESERDLALWLHAEAAWRVEGLVGQVNTLGDAADERQARIDAVKPDRHPSHRREPVRRSSAPDDRPDAGRQHRPRPCG